MITGITVSYNTQHLLQIAFNSVRKFHQDMPIILIDGSDSENECYKYARTLDCELYQTDYNIGHGKGMDLALSLCKTPYALIFDSDIEMLKSPVNAMLKLMESDTFGIGWCNEIASDGFDYGCKPQHKLEKPIKYLHPYFQLINVENYHKFEPYCHHGAPCYKTMIDIHNRGLSDKIIKVFPGLGHTGGESINWKGSPKQYIKHDFGGTRINNRKNGLKEIDGIWEK